MDEEERQRLLLHYREKAQKTQSKKKSKHDGVAADGSGSQTVPKKRRKEPDGAVADRRESVVSSASTSCTDETSDSELSSDEYPSEQNSQNESSSLPCNDVESLRQPEVEPWSSISNEVFDPLTDEDKELISMASDLTLPIVVGGSNEPSLCSPRDLEVGIKIEECNQKLVEYQSALTQRDALIAQLTERLQITIKQRDQYREEGTTQAEDLANEMNILKLQLQKANEFLQNQKGKNGISASELLDAQNQVIALQQTSIQKDAALHSLAQGTNDLHRRVAECEATLADERRQSENRLAERDAENSRLREQSDELTERLRRRNDENEELRRRAETLDGDLLAVRVERDQLLTESRTKDELNAQIQADARREKEKAELLAVQADEELKSNKRQASLEIQQLMEQLEEQQRKATAAGVEARNADAQLERLMAEADERHGYQIVQMKESVQAQFVERLRQLEEQLAEVVAERDRLSILTAAGDVTATTNTATTGLLVAIEHLEESMPPLSPNSSFLSSASDAWNDKLREVISEKESQETGFREQLGEVQRQLFDAETRIRIIHNERTALTAELTERTERIVAMEAELENARSQSQILAERLATLEAESATKYSALQSNYDRLNSQLTQSKIEHDANCHEKDLRLDEERLQLNEARLTISDLQRQSAEHREHLDQLDDERKRALAEMARSGGSAEIMTSSSDAYMESFNFVEVARRFREMEVEYSRLKDAAALLPAAANLKVDDGTDPMDDDIDSRTADEVREWKDKYESLVEEKLELEMRMGQMYMTNYDDIVVGGESTGDSSDRTTSGFNFDSVTANVADHASTLHQSVIPSSTMSTTTTTTNVFSSHSGQTLTIEGLQAENAALSADVTARCEQIVELEVLLSNVRIELENSERHVRLLETKLSRLESDGVDGAPFAATMQFAGSELDDDDVIKSEKSYVCGTNANQATPGDDDSRRSTRDLVEIVIPASAVRDEPLVISVEHPIDSEAGTLRAEIERLRAALDDERRERLVLENAVDELQAELGRRTVELRLKNVELREITDKFRDGDSSGGPSTLRSELAAAVDDVESGGIVVRKAILCGDENDRSIVTGECDWSVETGKGEFSGVTGEGDWSVVTGEGDRSLMTGLPVTESDARGSDLVAFPVFEGALAVTKSDDQTRLLDSQLGESEQCLRVELDSSSISTVVDARAIASTDAGRTLEVLNEYQMVATTEGGAHHADKADSISCECTHDSSSSRQDNTSVWTPYLSFDELIEAAAQVTSRAALHNAQRPFESVQLHTDDDNNNIDDNDVARVLDAHRRFLTEHLSRLRVQVERDESGWRRLADDEKLEQRAALSVTVATSTDEDEALAELRQLRDILRDTEDKLRAAENAGEAGRLELDRERRFREDTVRALEMQYQAKGQELQQQYDEDVEHVRRVMEESFVQEAQADMETQVEFLRDKMEANIQERNEENARLCAELNELKVQILQQPNNKLQKDKCRLERYLCQESGTLLDDVQLEIDLDAEPIIAGEGKLSLPAFKQLSCSREDLRTANTSLRQTIANLIGIYVDVAKSINKSMVGLFGADLAGEEAAVDRSENPNISDRMDRFSSMVALFHMDVADVSFNETGNTSAIDTNYPSMPHEGATPNDANTSTTTAADAESTDNDDPELDPVLGEVAKRVGAKLSTTVERLLSMLSALLQHLQESRFAQDEWTNTSLQTDDELALLATQREELAAQLKAETQTRECLAGELHKVTGMLKAVETEKASLESTLSRKDMQLSQFMCQMDELEAQNQRLEDSLAEDHLSMDHHREIVAEGLGEQAQMVKHAPRTEPSQTQPALATGEQELLEENTRLMREKRGLQHRGEKDRSHLMARVQELEQTLDESAVAHERRLEQKRQEITDLQQQIDALDKQLRGYKQFIEEQTADREQEREDFQIEVAKLSDIVREKERAQSGEEQLSREVEALTEKVKQKERAYSQAVSKRDQLERDVEALTDKSKTQQDTIRELERQLDCKSRNERELGDQMEEMKVALSHTTKVHDDQLNEIEELRKMSMTSRMSTSMHFMDDYISIRGTDMDVPPTPESILLELRSQVHHLEDKVSRHVRDLEGFHVTSSSVSSPCSEEVSVREQLDVLRHIGRPVGGATAQQQLQRSDTLDPSFAAYVRDVQRLEDKVESLTRSRDVVLKMLKDYEVQLNKQKHNEEELIQDRDVLQQQLNAQFLQISGLQARIEDRRLGVHGVEILEKIAVVQEELDKRIAEVEKKTNQIAELEEDLSRVQLQCGNYKNQVGELRQRYTDDVAQNKAALSKADIKVIELQEENRTLNEDLIKSEKQLEEISSLLQTLMKEKNDEMDHLNAQVRQAESEKEQLHSLEKEQSERWQALTREVEEQKLKLVTLEETLREKEEAVSQSEKEMRRTLDMVDQKRREVDALKIVLEEKAQLVEQVQMLQNELQNLSQYQARLQEDFETVRMMLEDRQSELSLVQHELTEVQTVRDTSIEEKLAIKIELDRLLELESKRQASRTDAGVQYEETIGDLEPSNALLLRLTETESLLEAAVSDRSDAERRLAVLTSAKDSVDRQLEEVTQTLRGANDELSAARSELDAVRSQLESASVVNSRLESELSDAAQQIARLEAEIAWRDTKIFRLEDEVQQVMSIAASDNGDEQRVSPRSRYGDEEDKTSIQKFLEEMSQDVLNELLNKNSDDETRGGEGDFGPGAKMNGNSGMSGKEFGDDIYQMSNSTEVSGSDAESVSSSIRDAPPTLQVRTLMRRIYKEGINVLNLSELQAIEEHVNRSGFDSAAAHGSSPSKAWERERLLLITEVKALKELLSQMTAIVSASKQTQASRDPVSSHVNSLLRFVSNLLSMERETLLTQIKAQLARRSDAEVSLINNTVSKLNAVYADLLENIRAIRLAFGQSAGGAADSDSTDEWSSSVMQPSSKSSAATTTTIADNDRNESHIANVNWEVQMAVARERLDNQTKHKQLLRQLHAADQQMAQCERQAKRRAELTDFRVQQERIIGEDLRRSLDLEKTRNIEMCSQLALEKNRASHLTLSNVQLKSELAKYQLSLDQEKQELRNMTQLFRNEKLQTETLLSALQSERDNFAQMQEAIEAEKRRNKTSYVRQQQIIEELRLTLDNERQVHVDLTSALEREKLISHNAQREVSRWQQQQQRKRSSVTPGRGSGGSGNGSLCSIPDECGNGNNNAVTSLQLDDVREALELERRKSQDLGSILQKEHQRVSTLTTTLQQERRHLLEELESEQNVTSLLQSKTDALLVQKSKLLKDVQQGRELINRLEVDYEKACCELATTRDRLHQREQEVEALHRMQRDVQKEWEVGREQDRQQQLDMQIELQRFQQRVVILEKELDFAKQSELQLQRELNDDGRFVVSRGDNNYARPTSMGSGSLFQNAGLETIRQRLYLLLIKTRDELDGVPPAKKSRRSTSVSIVNTVGALLTELRSMGNESSMQSQRANDNLSHLGLMERIVRHNADLADFAARISEEKLELRRQQLVQSRDAASATQKPVARSSASTEHLLGAERAAWAQERAGLQMSLHRAEADLMRNNLTGMSTAASRRSGIATGRGEELRSAHYHQKFLRAEKFRKNLVYQKNYLNLLLSRYRDTEEATVDMLGRLGCLSATPAHNKELQSRAPLRRFRRYACVVLAIVRMRLLVRQWLVQQEQRQLAASGRPQRFEGFDAGSVVSTPSLYSARNHPSYLGCTPPVRDTSRAYSNVSGSERSMSPVIHCSGSRSLKTVSSGSSHSSPSPSNGRLSDYVHRFEILQQQFGIGMNNNNPETPTPPPVM